MTLFNWGKRDSGREADQPFYAARIPMPQSIMEGSNDEYLVETVVEIVNRLLFDGGFIRSELPPELLMSYSVDYYLAQVNNGGHAQFGLNGKLIEGTLSDIRAGLPAMGAAEAAAIFADFEQLLKNEPGVFRQAESEVWKNATMTALDARFNAGPSEALQAKNAAWLRTLPIFESLEDLGPDSTSSRALAALAANNPNAARRIAERQQRAEEARERDPLLQTLRFIVEQPGSPVTFERWVGGAQIEIEGYVGGEWGVQTSGGRARVLVLPHVGILQLFDGVTKPLSTPIAEIKRLVKKKTGQPVPPEAFCTRT